LKEKDFNSENVKNTEVKSPEHYSFACKLYYYLIFIEGTGSSKFKNKINALPLIIDDLHYNDEDKSQNLRI